MFDFANTDLRLLSAPLLIYYRPLPGIETKDEKQIDRLYPRFITATLPTYALASNSEEK